VIQITPESSPTIGLGYGAGEPGVATGGGAREPVWIRPARRHGRSVVPRRADSYSVVWAMPSAPADERGLTRQKSASEPPRAPFGP
jgi:hypothetical protein